MYTQTESEQDAVMERLQGIQARQDDLREINKVHEPQARSENPKFATSPMAELNVLHFASLQPHHACVEVCLLQKHLGAVHAHFQTELAELRGELCERNNLGYQKA